MTKTSVMVRS